MKLDLDYIKEILETIENHKSSQILLGELMEAMNITLKDDDIIDKLAGHLRLLTTSLFLFCNSEDCGFIRTMGASNYTLFTGARYEMTLQGYQILDAMRNDSLMEKIKGYFKEQGISGIKQAPAYLIGIATQYLLKS